MVKFGTFLVMTVVRYYMFFVCLVLMAASLYAPFTNLLPVWLVSLFGSVVGFMLAASFLEYVSKVSRALGVCFSLASSVVWLSVLHCSDVQYLVLFVFALMVSVVCSAFFFFSYELSKVLDKRG